MLFPLFDLNPHQRFPLFTLLIIAANVAVTVWMSAQPEARQNQIAMEYGFVPARLSQAGKRQELVIPIRAMDERGRAVQVGVAHLSTKPAEVYFTFVSTMFLHGGWLHLLMNMWMLWIFGNNIEDRLGHFVFVLFYMLGGVIATLVFWATAPEAGMPVVGASGAVAAVLGAYAITFPTAKVRTLVFFLLIFIVDIPALVLLGIWFLLQVSSGLLGMWGIAQGPVAFWSHIGGFIAGMILMPLFSLGASPPGTNWRKESDELFRYEDRRFS
jgi:membrane associated rhomboid family serine protease